MPIKIQNELTLDLLRQVKISNVRTVLLRRGWTENQRTKSLLSTGTPRMRFDLGRKDGLAIQEKIYFTANKPYTRGTPTWKDVDVIPWDQLEVVEETGAIGRKVASRRRSVEQKATEAKEAPAEVK